MNKKEKTRSTLVFYIITYYRKLLLKVSPILVLHFKKFFIYKN
uniref:Uncharacterized protein n=1 Tax=biofilter metagenome TaxID=1070537 RepID=A0A193SBP7_9ZZZZ